MLNLGGVTPWKMNGKGTPKLVGAWTTQLKIMSQKWVHLPQARVQINNIWNHHLAKSWKVDGLKNDFPFSITVGDFLASKSFISPGCIAWGFENVHQHRDTGIFVGGHFGLETNIYKGGNITDHFIEKSSPFLWNKKTLWKKRNRHGPFGFGSCFICRMYVEDFQLNSWAVNRWYPWNFQNREDVNDEEQSKYRMGIVSLGVSCRKNTGKPVDNEDS